MKRQGRTLALMLAQRGPLQVVVLGREVVVGRDEIGVVGRDEVGVGREEVVEGEMVEGKAEKANVVPLGDVGVFAGTNVDVLVLACNNVDVPLAFELDEEVVDDDEARDDVVLAGKAEGVDDVVGVPPGPRPRLRHRSPVHPSAAVGFTVVLNGLDMVFRGCVGDEEVVLVLTEEEVDKDEEDIAELGEVLNEFVEVLPLLDPPLETEDEGDVADVTVLVELVDELDVVGPPLPPNIGKLALTQSSPEHPEAEAGTDGDEMLVEEVVIVGVVGLAVELFGLKVKVFGINVEVTVETLMHAVPVHELALPEPVAIVTDDGNDGGVVVVGDGAFPPPRPSERQRSPLQDDAAEGDSTVARVAATLLPNGEEGGDSVNVCVIV
ncbi:MAG: hypothetical protein Q9204_006837 [Flavoplaca sp. TL-2023a]